VISGFCWYEETFESGSKMFVQGDGVVLESCEVNRFNFSDEMRLSSLDEWHFIQSLMLEVVEFGKKSVSFRV